MRSLEAADRAAIGPPRPARRSRPPRRAELARSGYFNGEALFWREGQEGWRPLRELPALAAALAAPPPPRAAPAAAAAAAAPPAAAPPSPEERAFVDDDGTRYAWDSALRRFVAADEGDGAGGAGAGGGAGGAAAAAPAYDAREMEFEAEAVPGYEAPPPPSDEEGDWEALVGDGTGRAAKNAAAAAARRKRARGAADGEGGAAAAAPPQQQPPAAAKPKPKPAPRGNTSVYVSGLPPDASEAELAAAFARCGVLLEDAETRRPRARLYRDAATGAPKGDGLVTFLKEPSVALAVALLDGAPLRPGGAPPMAVAPARFEAKAGGGAGAAKPKPKSKKKGKDKAAAAADAAAAAADDGAAAAAPPAAPAPPGGAAAKRARRKAAEAQERRLAWGGFDDAVRSERATVVLRGLFDPAELSPAAPGGAATAAELERDVRGEAARAGRVGKLRVFARHPEGVVVVKFEDEEAAAACVAALGGRWFGGRRVTAALWDGLEDFAAAEAAVPRSAAEEAEEAARLEAFGRELEG